MALYGKDFPTFVNFYPAREPLPANDFLGMKLISNHRAQSLLVRSLTGRGATV